MAPPTWRLTGLRDANMAVKWVSLPVNLKPESIMKVFPLLNGNGSPGRDGFPAWSTNIHHTYIHAR